MTYGAEFIPQKPTEGILVETVRTRNKYSKLALEIPDLELGVTYGISLFPVSTDGDVNINNANKVYIKMEEDYTIIYGFEVDSSEADPECAVTYLEDAVGKTPAYMNFDGEALFNWGNWAEDEFFIPRPCMLKYDGTVDYYLDPNDYTKKEDGTDSDVSNDDYEGNAMMEWGRDNNPIWIKIVPDSTTFGGKVYISNKQVDENYTALSFTDSNGVVHNHFYSSIYINSCDSAGRERSLSNKNLCTINNNRLNIDTFTDSIKLNNISDEIWTEEKYVDRSMVTILLILLTKSLSIDYTIGYGYRESGNTKYYKDSGVLDKKGLFYGVKYTSNTNLGMKLFGMEHYIDNVRTIFTGVAEWFEESYNWTFNKLKFDSRGIVYPGRPDSNLTFYLGRTVISSTVTHDVFTTYAKSYYYCHPLSMYKYESLSILCSNRIRCLP